MEVSSSGATGAANVSNTERLVSLTVGSLLLLYGVRRRSWPAAVVAGAGGLLLWRGATGRSYAYRRLGIERADAPAELRASVTINRPRHDVYGFWRSQENLPHFMSTIRSVQRITDTRYRWVAQPIGGVSVEWEAEITEDRPDELLRWQSLPGADFENHGTVRFSDAPGGRGTELHVEMLYRPKAGLTLAKLLRPLTAQLMREDLRRLKRVLEVGEVPTIEGQPAARAA